MTFGKRLVAESIFGDLEIPESELRKQIEYYGEPDYFVVVNGDRIIGSSHDEWPIAAIVKKTEEMLYNYEEENRVNGLSSKFNIEVVEEASI